jgi:exopolysaccharide production protein ExoZ
MTYGSVQYARALAALAVVLYHGITVMNTDSHFLLFEYGKYGVDLFFVISGFIMVVTTPSGGSAGEFFLKRLVRIIPLYWLATFILVLAAAVVPAAFRSTEVDAGRLAMSLAFIPHHHAVVTHQIWPILIQGWTLNYEMYFYVLFSLALLAGPGRHVLLLSLFLVAAISVGLFLSFQNAILRVYTSPMLIEFLLGVFLGKVVGSANRSHLVIFNGAVTLAAVVSITLLGFGVPVDRPEFVGFTAAALLGWWIWLEGRGASYTNKVILLVANASYSIYLFHTFALGAVRFSTNKLGLQWSAWSVDIVTIILGTVLSVIVGITSYLIFEKPVQSFMRHWLFKKPRRLTAVTEGTAV